MLNKELNKLYKKILAKKIIRICIYLTFLIFYPGIILAIIIADTYGSKKYDIFNNYISDLGSIEHSPAPYILNAIAISAGILLIPIFLYLEEIIVSGSNYNKRFLNSSISIKVLAKIGKICFMFGSFGMVGVGVFNEDFSPFNIHYILAIILFGGFLGGGFFTGIIIIIKKTIIPRIMGYIMVFESSGIFIIYFFINIFVITFAFVEWCLFLSIIAWFIPITLILLNYLDKCNYKIQEHNKK